MTTKIVCKLCGAPAKQAEPEVYRHAAESPWDDQSGFCDKYGYPIPVVESESFWELTKDLAKEAEAMPEYMGVGIRLSKEHYVTFSDDEDDQ